MSKNKYDNTYVKRSSPKQVAGRQLGRQPGPTNEPRIIGVEPAAKEIFWSMFVLCVFVIVIGFAIALKHAPPSSPQNPEPVQSQPSYYDDQGDYR